MIVDRPRYLDLLIAKKGNGLVKTVTGVRRCGKSFLLFELFKRYLIESGVPEGNIVEMAFDEFGARRMRNPNAFYPWAKERLSGDGERYLLLDEVQLLENFEEVLIGLSRIPGVDIYVTGSNAKLLSRDVITEFRGRGDEIRVWPLSFSEFSSAWTGDARRRYEEYSVYGGMPATLNMNSSAKIAYLQSIFSKIYVNDIVERNALRNTEGLETLLDVLSSSVGSLTNPKRVADTFKSSGLVLTSDTVRSYIDALRDAFIIEEAKRFDVKGRKYIGSPFKYYFCDLGLRNARVNFRQVEPTHAMENVLYNELRARAFSVDVGVVTAYSKDNEGGSKRTNLEIDFVANKGSSRFYIQSAYAIPDREKRDQETRSLRGVSDSFKKIVVLRDPIVARYDENGVLFVGLEEFLANESYLEA